MNALRVASITNGLRVKKQSITVSTNQKPNSQVLKPKKKKERDE